jgi:hypothetical protein
MKKCSNLPTKKREEPEFDRSLRSPSDSNEKPWTPMIAVLTNNPRSGTHYLKNLISAALGIRPLERDLSAPGELRAAISAAQGSELIYGHFRFSQHAAILDDGLIPDLRVVVLTRHPFDRLISQLAYETVLNGRLPDPNHLPQQLARDLLLGHWDGRPWKDGMVVNDYPAWHNFLYRDLVTDWLDNRNCHLVKFEDLISNPAKVLSACVNFLGFDRPHDTILQITRKINFSTLSGGRKPGQLDPKSHYRKGVPGEWRDIFSPSDIWILKEKYSELFARCGYDVERGYRIRKQLLAP